MNQLKFLYLGYSPNTATFNRAQSYWKVLDKLGIKVEVTFFFPDSNYNKVKEVYKNITFKYYWDKYYIKHRALKYISYYFYRKDYIRKIKEGDILYLYELPDLLQELTKKNIH